jgi:hypothetical protein
MMMILREGGWRLFISYLFIFAISTGCERVPPPVPRPPFRSQEAAAQALELYDTNKDGKISGAELDQAPGLNAALKVIGTNKESGITPEMIEFRVEKWIDSKIGRTSLSCLILHNGKPLEGATVKFIPEKFLAAYLKEEATGMSNPTGMAMVSVPMQSGPYAAPPGIPPGMYRVEITKEGDNIPARYNTASELGQEVSLDNFEMQKGIKFDLKY